MGVTLASIRAAEEARDAAIAKEREIAAKLEAAQKASEDNQRALMAKIREIRSGTGSATEKANRISQAQAVAKEEQKEIESEKASLNDQLQKQAETIRAKNEEVKRQNQELGDQKVAGAAAGAARLLGKKPPGSPAVRGTACPPCKSVADQASSEKAAYDKLEPVYEDNRKKLGETVAQLEKDMEDVKALRADLDRLNAALQAGRQVMMNRGKNSDLERNVSEYQQRANATDLALGILIDAIKEETKTIELLNKELERDAESLAQTAFRGNKLTTEQLPSCEAKNCPPPKGVQNKKDKTAALKAPEQSSVQDPGVDSLEPPPIPPAVAALASSQAVSNAVAQAAATPTTTAASVASATKNTSSSTPDGAQATVQAPSPTSGIPTLSPLGSFAGGGVVISQNQNDNVADDGTITLTIDLPKKA